MTYLSEIPVVFISVLLGYFIGSLSFPRLALSLASVGRNEELRNDTSTIKIKFGADRASIVLGAKFGVLMGILDMLKVATPMIIFKFLLYPGKLYHLVLSVAGLVGHNWPIYYRFKGGRGFSVILSSFIVVDWVGAIMVMFLSLTTGMGIVQNPMVAYVSWLWLMVPWLWVRTLNYAYLLYSTMLILIFLLTTVSEIKAFIQHRREGKLEAFFGQGLHEASPRWRGMKRMQERLNTLGSWRFVVSAIALIALALVFTRLPPL